MLSLGKSLFAAATLAASVGTASAAVPWYIVDGTYSLEGDIPAYGVTQHPDAALLPPAGVHMESTGGSPYYFTNMRFEPNAPITLGQIDEFSFDYQVLAGAFGGGSVRAFLVLDVDNDGVEEIGPNGAGNPAGGPPFDEIIQVTPYLVDSIGFPAAPASGSTGNLMAVPDADAWSVLFGPANTGGLSPLAPGNYPYPAIEAAYANVNVLSFTLVHDSGNGSEFDIQNAYLYVPEPASLGLLAAGGLMTLRRRRA
jgi:hypothetical protein